MDRFTVRLSSAHKPSGNLKPLVFKNPILTASGTFGYGVEFANFGDLAHLGGIVVKGLSLKPRPGNPLPRVAETPCGMLNAVGLQNPGVEAFVRDELPFLRGFDTNIIANITGMEPRPGSMGKPVPQFDVDIVDEDGNSVPAGVTGEIVVRTDKRPQIGLFTGYYRDEALTKKAWHDGLYHTGDTAWRDEDGYYWYVGRTDDIIKSSGYRIGPFEIESVLMEHPSVLECAITGVPDPVRGQIVKATIVLARGYTPSEELKKELQDYVKKQTAPYKYPRAVEFVEDLPKTISGKIRRAEIRDADKAKS